MSLIRFAYTSTELLCVESTVLPDVVSGNEDLLEVVDMGNIQKALFDVGQSFSFHFWIRRDHCIHFVQDTLRK